MSAWAPWLVSSVLTCSKTIQPWAWLVCLVVTMICDQQFLILSWDSSSLFHWNISYIINPLRSFCSGSSLGILHSLASKWTLKPVRVSSRSRSLLRLFTISIGEISHSYQSSQVEALLNKLQVSMSTSFLSQREAPNWKIWCSFHSISMPEKLLQLPGGGQDSITSGYNTPWAK